MSVSSQPIEPVNWNPSISEIAELLQTLGISPPQSFDENLLATPPISWRDPSKFEDHEEAEIPKYGREGETAIDENYDRKSVIEQLQAAKEDGKSIKRRNNYFHEYLVEHFKRKQMMHVYATNESEDDALLNEYLRKLDELERSNEDLRVSSEEWDAELTRTRAEIRDGKDHARSALNEMIAKERTFGASTWYCGKPLSLKKVQAMIARQLDRIRDIAKFRIRYTRLRDEYSALEVELRHRSISSPDLTKEDYERLEAEQFCYKRDLRIINERCEEFCKRRDSLMTLVAAMIRTIAKIDQTTDHYVAILSNLKNSIRAQLEDRRIRLVKLADAKNFIREFNEIIGQTERPEFVARISKLREEHDEWMEIIASLLRTVKDLGQSLNSLRANLMLHGRELEKVINDDGDESLLSGRK